MLGRIHIDITLDDHLDENGNPTEETDVTMLIYDDEHTDDRKYTKRIYTIQEIRDFVVDNAADFIDDNT